jgi:ribosomal protein L37AE/L43A
LWRQPCNRIAQCVDRRRIAPSHAGARRCANPVKTGHRGGKPCQFPFFPNLGTALDQGAEAPVILARNTYVPQPLVRPNYPRIPYAEQTPAERAQTQLDTAGAMEGAADVEAENATGENTVEGASSYDIVRKRRRRRAKTATFKHMARSSTRPIHRRKTVGIWECGWSRRSAAIGCGPIGTGCCVTLFRAGWNTAPRHADDKGMRVSGPQT